MNYSIFSIITQIYRKEFIIVSPILGYLSFIEKTSDASTSYKGLEQQC